MKNKKIGILLLTALLSLSGCVMAKNAGDYNSNKDIILEKVKANKETVAKAQEAMQNKDFEMAISLLTAYINEKPKKYEIYKLRGDAYYALRRYDLAQKDYQSAIDIKANSDKIMTNTKYVSAIVLGADKNEQLQNVELGDLYGALMYAQKAQNDSAYTVSYENAQKYNSHIYLPQPNKNDINKINCPQKYGKIINPQGIDIKIYGAINDIEAGNYSEAVYKLQSVTNEYPNYYLGHYLTGVALSELEKDDDAIKSFEKAISLNPYDFESYASLGRIYYSKAETTFSDSDGKKSIEYFNKAAQLNKNCPTYYFYIGMNELQAGNTNVAIYNFDKALQINSSDYNSMYYKLISQYMSGNYQDVVDGTTKLLYKHVSNYNSVLYLRALAYTKLNDTEKALQDLDSAENNIEDIYNIDIKQISSREKSLESYIHYMKSEIQHLKGLGAASDNSRAYSNPIINRLANAKKAIAPYEKSLEGETVSLSDYNKFESFYSTSLPKLLESGAVITYEDIDNQYDYIRTTFSDIGVSFVYLNPDYKITTIKDYPYKKYSSKLKTGELDSLSVRPVSETKNVQLAKVQNETLKKATPKSELLVQSGQISLAQMLASNDLYMGSNKPKPQSVDELKPLTSLNNTANKQFMAETPAAETINTAKNIASGEIYTSDATLLNSENRADVRNILDSEKKMADNVPEIRITKAEQSQEIKKLSAESDSLKSDADKIKQTDDVIESKENPKSPDVTVVIADQETKSVEILSDNAIAVIDNVKEETKEQLKAQKELEKELKKQAKAKKKSEQKIQKQLNIKQKEAAKAQKQLQKQLPAEEKALPKTGKKVIKKIDAAQKQLMMQANIENKQQETEESIEPANILSVAENTPKIAEKQTNTDIENFNINNSSKTITIDNTDDVVVLDINNNRKGAAPASDIFTIYKKFFKPQNQMSYIDASNANKAADKETDVTVSDEQVQNATPEKVISEIEVQNIEVSEMPALETASEQISKNSEHVEDVGETVKSLETDKAYVQKQLSDFLNASMPEKFFKKQDEALTQTAESEKENIPVTKLQREENQKLKPKQVKSEENIDKSKSVVTENEDETKLKRLKSRLADGCELSEEEKKAQKEQLKAERAAAKKEYKAGRQKILRKNNN